MGHYETCRRGIGRPVQIRMNDGSVRRGVIDRVSQSRVFLRPLGGGHNFGGYGYGYGYGWGGFGAGIALGAIAAIAFLPFFW